MTLSRRVGAFAALIVLGAIAWIIPGQVAAWGAGALLYPVRQHVAASVPDTCASVEFLSAGTRLRGWRCGSDADRRGDHSRRVFEAVQSKKRLIIVPDAAHNRSLDGDVWNDIDRWIDDALQ